MQVLQTTLERVVASGTEERAENAEIVRQLMHHAAGVVEALDTATMEIGNRAEQAATRVVGDQVRESLSGATAIVDKVARAALKPLMDAAVKRIEEAQRAEESLDRRAVWFSNRALAIMAAVAAVALTLIGVVVWGTLAWQRSAISNNWQQLSELGTQNTQLQNEITEMLVRAQKLRAENVTLEFGKCTDPDTNKEFRCVAARPGSQRWGDDAAPFFILKGD